MYKLNYVKINKDDQADNHKLALEALQMQLGTIAEPIGIIQVTSTNCVAIFIGEFAGKKYGAIRQFLYGNKEHKPTFTRKGLNATREEWVRIANVLRDVEKRGVSGQEFTELLRLPLDDGKNAIQVYYHVFKDAPRIVIGKLYDYKSYSGKCGGASFDISEIGKVIDCLDVAVESLDVEKVKIPAVGISKTGGVLEVKDDFSNLL